MTKEKLNQLQELLGELKDQRLKELAEKYYGENICDMSEEELYSLDDGNCLIEHIDAIKSFLEDL